MNAGLANTGPAGLILRAAMPEPVRLLLAAPLRNTKLWVGLGWSDVVQSYRRTMLGPFWISINLGIFATAMTLVYGALFGVPTGTYAGYVVCGMIAWLWISALLTDVGNTFVQYAPFLKGTPIDKALFVWASVFKQVIALAHHLIVFAVLILIGFVQLTPYTLLVIPALGVLFLFSIPVTAAMAILFARYRDLQRLISSVTIVIMMITPIFWESSMLTGWRTALVDFNPIYYLIEFIRRPMLGLPLELLNVSVVLAMTLVAWITGSILYKRYEKYVVFWI